MSRLSSRPISRLSLPWKLLIIFSLWQFAIGQPILDLLGKAPEFFVAHGARPVDLILFALVYTVGGPAIVCGLLWLAMRLHPGSFEVLYLALLGWLLFLIVLPHTHFLESYHRYATVAGALAAAALLTTLLARSAAAQEFSKFLALAIIVVPLNFLLLSPANRLLESGASMTAAADGGPGASATPETLADIPVVLLLFDALPLSSLMTVQETIDGERFPAFAELASTATWYRSAITLSDSTSMAVPGILAGTAPEDGRIPTTEDYPANLFALLRGRAELFAHESLTNLCPDPLCRKSEEASFAERFRLLLDDSAIAYLHYLLPAYLRAEVPSIGEQWQGFRAEEAAPTSRGAQRRQIMLSEGLRDLHALFRKNIEHMRARDGAAFYFQHLMVPHVPWRYVPSGKEYGIKQRAGLTPGGRWSNDDWLVTQAYQRHLLQLGAADGLVGESLDHLEAQGIFERALVIVTADHGASFAAGLLKRAVKDENRADVGNIPLLVKYPGQSSGRIVDGLVRSIDIAPTIAAILGLPPVTEMDGADLRSLESGTLESVQVHRIARPAAMITLEDLRSLRRSTLLRKERLFPRRGHGPNDWFYPATEFDIVGEPVEQRVRQAQGGALQADIWQREDFRNLDLTRKLLPLRTMGRLQGLSAADSAPPLAIALNGRVAAVTRPYRKGDMVLYSAMLPEDFLQAGDNELAVYAIGSGPGGSITLTLLGKG